MRGGFDDFPARLTALDRFQMVEQAQIEGELELIRLAKLKGDFMTAVGEQIEIENLEMLGQFLDCDKNN